MRVLMHPLLSSFANEESGIKRVVDAYHRYAPRYGVEFVECRIEDERDYDLFAVHAGTTDRYPIHKPVVSHLHGLYWTADYYASMWEWHANANVVKSIRRALSITVPSAWVGETIARDVRVFPHIIHHGIDLEEWNSDPDKDGYVLWNKNRNMDVCDPEPVGKLAEAFPDQWFVSTFAPRNGVFRNVEVVGVLPRDEMKDIIQKSAIYLSTTKETFGIGILEALASGSPVLGFAHGGNLEIVQHGVNGYLAKPGDYEDLAKGLQYCLDYLEVLSRNARETAKEWGWEKPIKKLVGVYEETLKEYQFLQRPTRINQELYTQKI